MTTLSSKGQIVIQARIRRSRGWEPGQELDFVESDGEVAVRPAEPTAIDADDVRAAPDRLREGVTYTGPPIPVERLGMEVIESRDLYPDDE